MYARFRFDSQSSLPMQSTRIFCAASKIAAIFMRDSAAPSLWSQKLHRACGRRITRCWARCPAWERVRCCVKIRPGPPDEVFHRRWHAGLGLLSPAIFFVFAFASFTETNPIIRSLFRAGGYLKTASPIPIFFPPFFYDACPYCSVCYFLLLFDVDCCSCSELLIATGACFYHMIVIVGFRVK